jgi:nucleotide-binding universal stress UspA family protein
MNTLKRDSIVVGVDEVALAGQAVRWAGEQAALEGRRILLVRAASPVTTGWSTHAMDVPPGTFTSQRLHGEELLTRARDQVHAVAPDVEVEELFEVTDPRTLILRAAEGAHLVVLGSRGRGPLLSHVLGSVGVAVARRARCPVVVHRPGRAGRVHDGVVVAVDATEDAIPVLEHAFHQASLRGLPLRVVHYVMDPRSALVGVLMVGDLAVQMEGGELALSEAMAGMRERYPDVRATVRTAPGLAEHDVATAATRADLLVVGTHQRPAADRLLVGSVSTAVLEHATCPVAVVPVRSS